MAHDPNYHTSTSRQGSKGLRDPHMRHKKTRDYRRRPKFTPTRAPHVIDA